ncbi:MAG: glycosyltransferase [Bacteroidetes bacterium]|nr:glycosyltransferase [Bacteroidota bacterium]
MKQQNCEDVVLWVNEVGDKYYDYLNCANGFVLTSQFESFSLVTLEALYLGLPVVANDCIGVKEILQEKYGFVVKQKNNPEEMAEKCYNIASSELKVNKEELKQRALDFNIDKIGENWQQWLKEQI